MIDLSQGSPRFDLLPQLSAKLLADRRGWPPINGLLELRQAVADKLRSENEVIVDPANEILITAGAIGAVQTIFDTFVNHGDAVVLMDPCSPLYSLAAQTRCARIHWLPTWMEDGKTRFRLEHLLEALRGAKMLVVVSPANPTGGILTPDDLEQLVWWAGRHDVLLLSDETFERFQYDGEQISLATIGGARGRTLTVGSVSKSHALAAARVGWLAGPQALVRLCQAMSAMRTPFVATQSQMMATEALRGDPARFTAIAANFDARRQYVYESLRAVGLNVAWPSGGFFFWIPVWQHDVSDQEFCAKVLSEQKVRLTPGGFFGPSGAGFVRLSFAGDEGRLHEGLSRLRQCAEHMNEQVIARRAA
ncbi:MAG: pyridoxal phosphate-dependent aminotransferase [Candidatus Acidiferrum sp.]